MTFTKICQATALLTTTLLTTCRPPEKPVSKQEALDYAKKIETSVIQHNPNLLDNIIDDKYFAALVLRQAHQNFNFSLSKQAKTLLGELQLGKAVISTTRQAGAYQLLRQYEKDGHQHLLFRLFGDDGDLNYNDFELVKGEEGVRAVDVYVYASGEQLSKTLAESFQEASKASDMTDQEKENARLIANAEQYLKGGNPEEANSYYDQLPDTLKKERKIQKLHIRIADKLGDSTIQTAMNEYKSLYPDDPFIYITILRTAEKHKNYAAALDATNRLETFLPSDPFLDLYRGLIYKALNDPLESRLALERFHARWPLFGPPIAELITNHIQAGHPDSAAMLIKEAQQLNNITPQQLEAIKKALPQLLPYLK